MGRVTGHEIRTHQQQTHRATLTGFGDGWKISIQFRHALVLRMTLHVLVVNTHFRVLDGWLNLVDAAQAAPWSVSILIEEHANHVGDVLI